MSSNPKPSVSSPDSPGAGRAAAPVKNRWPLATVLIVALLLAGGITFYVVEHVIRGAERVADAPERILTGMAAAFKPTTTSVTEIHTAIGTLNHEAKLVVLTTTIDAEIRKSSATNWGYVYWGTTRVSLRAHDNKVQYFVPLAGISPADFSFDERTKILTVTVPAPRLDESMVDVQSDPRKIEVETSLGWAKFDKWSGEPLREEAQQALREAVLSVGNHEILQNEARQDAKKALLQLLAPLGGELRDDVTLEIAFQPS